jgi:hypothetical protein
MDLYINQEEISRARIARRVLTLNGKEVQLNLPGENFFPEYDHINSSFPIKRTTPKWYQIEIAEFNNETTDIPIAPLPSLSEYKECDVDVSYGLNLSLLGNIVQTKKIKDIYWKILTKQNPIDQPRLLPPKEPYQKVWDPLNLPPFNIDFLSSQSIIKKSIGYILSHQGFDGCGSIAMSMLQDVCSQLLWTAGKTVKEYIDKHGKDMSSTEILIHSLKQMGLRDPIELNNYVNLDVIRYGRKLYELKRRMESAWEDTQTTDIKDDIEFDNHQEEFANGNFMHEMGVDFLNLKDCGIDIGMVLKIN